MKKYGDRTMRKEIDVNAPLTKEQKDMVKRAKKKPVVYDDDSPELTDEELSEFRRVSDLRKAERRKQTVTIRLSSKALNKAKSLGKGYTSVLSRILEEALDDNDLIRRCL